MRVLIACEESAVVRDAFHKVGVWRTHSCDILTTRGDPRAHIQCDVLKILDDENWDLMIAFPPCTHLAVSGARWFKDKQAEQTEAIAFFMALANARIPRIAIENPIGIMSTCYRKPDQIIQPWMFGHGETKATCLWLKNLPPLKPTKIVEGRLARIHRMAPSKTRARDRSETYQGIATAMAEQWGTEPLPTLDPVLPTN